METVYKELMDSVPDAVEVGPVSALKGTVNASPSKSYTHRAIMVGGLGQNSVVENPLVCADTAATCRLWQKMGATIDYDDKKNALRIKGVDGTVNLKDDRVDVGEAGTLLRLVLPGLSQCSKTVTVDGAGTIRSRPNSSVVRPLRELGVDIKGTGPDDCVPIKINGNGPISCGEIRLDGTRSSQAISAFLLWAPTFKPGGETVSEITVKGSIVSRPYIEITLDALKWGGIDIEHEDFSRFTIPGGQAPATDGKTFRVGGDYSSAAFVLAAASLVESDVTLEGLHEDRQGDRAILDILREMGADVQCAKDSVTIRGPAELKGIELDCANTPDLVPVLTVLACFASTKSCFFNVGHLKIKESNRLSAPAEELRKLGAKINFGDSEITVEPSRLTPAKVHSHDDHRLAMALSVAGLRAPGTVVEGMKSIAKSYPTFLRDMRQLGASVRKPPGTRFPKTTGTRS